MAYSAEMEKCPVVLLDAYGTLFDVYSVSLLAEQCFAGQGDALARLWRDKQIEYTHLVTACNGGAHYRPFWELTRSALRYACARLALPLSEGQEQQLMNQYRHLSAFPENRAVLQTLKQHGVVTGILSNGDPDMLGVGLRSTGLDGLIDHVISVDRVRKYKTHPEAYALGPQTTGVPASETLFVSSNSWDALGATWFGYRSLWVNRQQLPFDMLGAAPSHVGRDLRDILPLLGLEAAQQEQTA